MMKPKTAKAGNKVSKSKLFEGRTREAASKLGFALEGARAEEKEYGPMGTGAALLRRAQLELGIMFDITTRVPELLTPNKNIVVLEDRETRNSQFRSWFGATNRLTCCTTLLEAVFQLSSRPVDVLFIDYDIHDKGTTDFRHWLRVSDPRRELDGLDLAHVVADRLPEHMCPKRIVVHSRNPVGRHLIGDYLKASGIDSVLWPFDYQWKGLAMNPLPILNQVRSQFASA